MTGGFNAQLRDILLGHGDAPALMTQDGQVLSFARVERAVASLATRLAAEGIGPGMRVAPLTDNRAVRILLMLALLRRGVEVAMMPAPGALAALGLKVDAVIRFAEQPYDGPARSVVFAQGWLEAAPDPDLPIEEAGALLVATSGSTGMPRFLRLRPGMYLDMVRNFTEGTGQSRGSVLVSIPEFTTYAIFLMLRAFVGGHGVMGMHPTPAETLEAAAQFGVREMKLTPLALNDLLAAIDRGAPVPELKLLGVFGAVASRELVARAERAFGVPVSIILGSSEIGQTSFGVADAASYVPGWSGRVLSDVEARIDPGPEGGESGRLFLRPLPKHRLEGYLGGAPVYDAEGWFDTGDLARFLPDGCLVIEGRADNVINLGGAKIAAELVEMLAGQSPGVTLAAATRLDPAGGGPPELGIAAVTGPGFDAEQVAVAVAARLRTTAKVRVIDCPALPHLPSGKLDRRALPGLFR